ncbi:hypothetical protein B0H11DRAFT_2021226 [Mycena galericulata]|nr:hypothetical protein B0H11DRAFT_2021226 [Mycena galericulata]
MAELEARPEWCLDLTFIHELLQTGYEFDGSQEVMFGKKIAGTELGWCLGTGILEARWGWISSAGYSFSVCGCRDTVTEMEGLRVCGIYLIDL